MNLFTYLFTVCSLCLVIPNLRCTLAMSFPKTGNQEDEAAAEEELVKEFRKEQLLQSVAEALDISPEDHEKNLNESPRSLLRIPQEILEENPEDLPDAEEDVAVDARHREAYIPGAGAGRHCMRRRTSGCFRFETEPINAEVTSAKLLVPTRMLTARHHEGFHHSIGFGMKIHGRRHVLTQRVSTESVPIKTKAGWTSLTLDVATVNLWMTQGNGEMLIDIRCHPFCPATNHKHSHEAEAVLHITYDRGPSRIRRRRSADQNCNSVTGCCKKDLTVNLDDLQLHSLSGPEQLKIDYCYGRCSSVVEAQRTTSVLHASIKVRMNNTYPHLRPKLKLCCVPTAYRTQAILMHSNGRLERTFLHDVSVLSCGCV